MKASLPWSKTLAELAAAIADQDYARASNIHAGLADIIASDSDAQMLGSLQRQLSELRLLVEEQQALRGKKLANLERKTKRCAAYLANDERLPPIWQNH